MERRDKFCTIGALDLHSNVIVEIKKQITQHLFEECPERFYNGSMKNLHLAIPEGID